MDFLIERFGAVGDGDGATLNTTAIQTAIIEGSHNVHISDCDIRCGDEAIVCLPSPDCSCENITATNWVRRLII